MSDSVITIVYLASGLGVGFGFAVGCVFWLLALKELV